MTAIGKSSTTKLDLSKQYLKEETADVIFICGQGENAERVPAHKFILFARSEYFDKMFNGLLAEKGKEITLPEVSPNAFRMLLRYFYFDECSFDIDTVNEVLKVADMYQIDGCLDACCKFLQKAESGENILIGYELAMKYKLKDWIDSNM